ncbi:unnamed protein product [Onchocerca ochengi]|uniref:Reverse transcriptase domain-containing protein n=1 Tax=Onchocerca ochengi TaxID=42157 RepID=A0A182E6F3_ONCOC|nr:unnamed protein product [Onchocerca ochengi]
MTTDILQKMCDQMEEDHPEAEDDEPISFVVLNEQLSDFMDEAIYNDEVIDITTPSRSSTGISEYSIILPRSHDQEYSFTDERSTSSPDSSESPRSYRR